MRRLPDGVFHCPACRAEVLPASVPEPGLVAARRSLRSKRRSSAPNEMKKEVRAHAREIERSIDPA
jgi:hypothetical protein